MQMVAVPTGQVTWMTDSQILSHDFPARLTSSMLKHIKTFGNNFHLSAAFKILSGGKIWRKSQKNEIIRASCLCSFLDSQYTSLKAAHGDKFVYITYIAWAWDLPWSGCHGSPVNTVKMNHCHKELSLRQTMRPKHMPQWQLEGGKENTSSEKLTLNVL